MGAGLGLAGVRGLQEPVGAGDGVSVCVGVGAGVVGPPGAGLGTGAGWAGTGTEGTGTGARLGGNADGIADGTWTEIDGPGTPDGWAGAGPCGECWAGSAVVWPALALGVDAEGDAAALGEALAVVEGAPDGAEPWLSVLEASCARDSWPKKGSSRAWPRDPAVNKMPTAPATTAMRLLIVRMLAAFLRTACGSWLNDEPVNEAGPTPARAAAGSAVVAALSVLAGSAVEAAAVAAAAVAAAIVAGATVGIAAVSLAWAARSRSAARAAARVVGTAVVGVAAGVGSGVELKGSEAGAATNGPPSLARRRPVGLVLSLGTWARRG
ncbi:hypothetical protein KNN17_14440 [Arthrobacter bambusae]|uniref:hypothetical protein n=1 Tax=Arthrobacter TaxID=1663 RepID=UPI001F50F6C5|nr:MULTISPECIES: hypothetical protein [Arthrobacter]MCI0142773.1 hypothetical protein [Arthrobacter bambusae]UYY81350.1 hypothetical protein OIT41_18975 [Arthrobacter sp. YA7-1]